MKRFIFIFAAALLFCSCSKQLDITVKDNRKSASTEPAYYWAFNNSGQTLKDVEFCINGTYFYKTDIAPEGASVDLFEFAAKDGKRFNIYETKPLTLSAKSKNGKYSVNFADIPFEPVPETVVIDGETYTKTREVLDFFQAPPLKTNCMDGIVYVELVLGVESGKTLSDESIENANKITAEIFTSKSAPDFKPQNERELQKELRNAIGVKDVKFMDLQFEPQ